MQTSSTHSYTSLLGTSLFSSDVLCRSPMRAGDFARFSRVVSLLLRFGLHQDVFLCLKAQGKFKIKFRTKPARNSEVWARFETTAFAWEALGQIIRLPRLLIKRQDWAIALLWLHRYYNVKQNQRLSVFCFKISSLSLLHFPSHSPVSIRSLVG